MLEQGVRNVLEKCNELLSAIKARQTGPRSYEVSSGLHHVKWMIEEILDNHEDWDARKINRWMGFIQGVLWSNGLFTITELHALRHPKKSKKKVTA